MEYEPNGPMYHAGQGPPHMHHMTPGHAFTPSGAMEVMPQMVPMRQGPPVEMTRMAPRPSGSYPGQGHPSAVPGGPSPGPPTAMPANGVVPGPYQRPGPDKWVGKYPPMSNAPMRGDMKLEDGPRGVPMQDWSREQEESRRRALNGPRDRGHERRLALYSMIRRQTQANMEMRNREEILRHRRAQLKQQHDSLCLEMDGLRMINNGPRPLDGVNGQGATQTRPMPKWLWSLVSLYLDSSNRARVATLDNQMEALTLDYSSAYAGHAASPDGSAQGQAWQWGDRQSHGPGGAAVGESALTPNAEQPSPHDAQPLTEGPQPITKRMRADPPWNGNDQAQSETKATVKVSEPADGDLASAQEHDQTLAMGRQDGHNERELTEQPSKPSGEGTDKGVTSQEGRADARPDQTMRDSQQSLPAPTLPHTGNGAPSMETAHQQPTQKAKGSLSGITNEADETAPMQPITHATATPPTAMNSSPDQSTPTGPAAQEEDSDEDSDSHLLIMKGPDSDDSD